MSEARRSSSLSDEQVLQRARSAENGRKFRLRFDRQYDDSTLQERYATRFKAEVALLANLAFWTGRDTEQMWRLFSRSELYRSELESYPGYRRALLDEATDLVDEVYTPHGD